MGHIKQMGTNWKVVIKIRLILLLKVVLWQRRRGCHLFYVCSDVFLDVVLLKGLGGTFNSVLLHLLRHICIFDHCFSVRHGCPGNKTKSPIMN